MSKLEYSYGSLDDMDEIIHLANTWWGDSSFHKHTQMEFKPDRQLFTDLYNTGSLLMLIGKDDEESIKACYIAVISNYMFNIKYKSASEVVWCIHKDHRHGREVFKLISSIEIALKSSGVDLYDLNFPVEEGKSSLADYLEKKKGFFKQDLSVLKEIK